MRPSALSHAASLSDGHALHASAQDLGKCWLIRSAELRCLLLSQLAFLDSIGNGCNEGALTVRSAATGGLKPRSAKTLPLLFSCAISFMLILCIQSLRPFKS